MNKKNIITIFIAIIISLAIFFIICGVKGVFSGNLTKTEVFRYLSDGFFAAGILELGVATILWVSKEGLFDGIRYGVTSLFRLHFSTKRMDWKEKESFSDYRERVHEKNDSSLLKILAIVGSIFIVLSIFMLIGYYK